MNNISKLVGLLAALASSVILSTQAAAGSFPDIIQLPDGWGTEGIATGRGTSFYIGCRGGQYKGAIYRGDYRTGQGEIIVPPDPDRVTLGLKVDSRSNSIFAAGARTGAATVFDGNTGEVKASFQFVTSGPTFVNDVTITRTAAFFTDSSRPFLYRVPLGANGELQGGFDVLPLSGFGFDPNGFNANGIAATSDGAWLIVVNMGTGILYRVNPETGASTVIDLGGASLGFGDGILLSGQTLHVVRNFLNLLTTVQLDDAFETGVVTSEVTSPALDVPATAAAFGNSVYLVNARFSTALTPATQYTIVKMAK